MSIAIPARKGLIVKKLGAERPDLTPKEIARLAGTNKRHVERSIAAERFGRDKPKSPRR